MPLSAIYLKISTGSDLLSIGSDLMDQNIPQKSPIVICPEIAVPGSNDNIIINLLKTKLIRYISEWYKDMEKQKWSAMYFSFNLSCLDALTQWESECPYGLNATVYF